MRWFGIPVAVAAVLCLSSSQAQAAACRTFTGDFAATRVPNCPAGKACLRGQITGGLWGTYDFVFDTLAPVAGGSSYTGSSTITTASGATVTSTDRGLLRVLGGLATSLTNSRVTGGSAEFAGATGAMVFQGRVDPSTLNTVGRYSANLCTP